MRGGRSKTKAKVCDVGSTGAQMGPTKGTETLFVPLVRVFCKQRRRAPLLVDESNQSRLIGGANHKNSWPGACRSNSRARAYAHLERAHWRREEPTAKWAGLGFIWPSYGTGQAERRGAGLLWARGESLWRQVRLNDARQVASARALALAGAGQNQVASGRLAGGSGEKSQEARVSRAEASAFSARARLCSWPAASFSRLGGGEDDDDDDMRLRRLGATGLPAARRRD